MRQSTQTNPHGRFPRIPSRRSFSHTSKASNGKAVLADAPYVDEVMFGLYDDAGFAEGEMAVRWYALNGRTVPRLESFDDAWHLFAEFKDVV